MRKNNQEDNGIVTSELPISTSDAPLVIDLPDGQKIVLGRIASGAVIEVATWRGTGRPDSRTNRIMLGMSDTSSLDQSGQGQKSENAPKKVKSRSKRRSLSFAPKIQLPQAITEKLSRYTAKAPVEETHDLEIDAWIEKLSADLQEKKSAPRAPKKSPANSSKPAPQSSVRAKKG